MNINTIANYLNNLQDKSNFGMHFDCYPIDGEVEVLQVNIIGREEIPIFVSVTANQILCISYLWGEDEIKENLTEDMLKTMLELNVSMPLSSFAKIGSMYAVYGALSTDANLKEIEQEITVLSDNCLEVIDELDNFLK